MAAINFPAASESPWYNPSNGITYEYVGGTWRSVNALSNSFDDEYVEVTGDNMTGNLTLGTTATGTTQTIEYSGNATLGAATNAQLSLGYSPGTTAQVVQMATSSATGNPPVMEVQSAGINNGGATDIVRVRSNMIMGQNTMDPQIIFDATNGNIVAGGEDPADSGTVFILTSEDSGTRGRIQISSDGTNSGAPFINAGTAPTFDNKFVVRNDGSATFANICKVSATDTSGTQFYWNQTEHEGVATGPGYLTTARKGDVSLLVNYITVPDGTENTKLISRWVTDGGAAEGGKDIIDFHSDGSVSFAGDIEYGGTGYIAEGDLGELLGDGNPSNEYGTVIGVKPKASYSTARDFIVNLNPALSASREVFRIKGQDGSATFKGEIQASDVVVTNNGIVKSAIWNIAADNDNFLVAPGSIVSHVSTTTGASRAAFEVYYGASSNQTAAIFANGSAHFKGNVTSDGTIGFNLEPDNPDNYTSTTDSEGNETQVYNGPTLDVKERIQTKTTSLLAIKAACEDANITTVDGLKTAIAAALANI